MLDCILFANLHTKNNALKKAVCKNKCFYIF